MSNILKEIEYVKTQFKSMYNKKDNTIEEQNYKYLLSIIFELITKVKKSDMNRAAKFLAKGQLQTMGMKIELAKKVEFTPHTSKEDLNKIIKHFENHDEAKIFGVDDEGNIIVATKVIDMTGKAIYNFRVSETNNSMFSEHKSMSKIGFYNELTKLSSNTQFEMYDAYNKKDI